jgi:PrtD family type I secretion system ABC transporter
MLDLLRPLRPIVAYAAAFSLVINLLLLAPALYMLQVFDRVLTSRHEETLLMLTLGTLLALVMSALLDMMRGWLLAAAAVLLDRRVGPLALERIVTGKARLGGVDSAGGLRDVNTVRQFVSGQGILALFDTPWMPVYLALIYLFHPLLGVIATAGAILLIVLAILNERSSRRSLAALHEETRAATRFIDSTVRNAEAATALGMVERLVARWQALNAHALGSLNRLSRSASFYSGLTRFSRQLLQIAMLAAGALLVIDANVTSGIMIAGTIILGRALAPVEMLIASWKNLMEAVAAGKRLGKLVDSAPQVNERLELPAPRGALLLENVVFAYRGAKKPALRGVSYSLREGDSLGIVGPSASGKSTLARLVIGLWPPNSGAVRLDGADIALWPRERLGRFIGYLPQDVELFPGTVAENIARFGEPDAEGVVAAAKRARVHDLILRLPEGYDTDLTEDRAALSPGQRQRIALARALYGSPALVVLDEPNSNLDSEGERALLDAMAELRQARVTLVVVAHRPSLFADVDKMLVLRDGQVEMFGPRADIVPRVTLAPARASNA